MKLSEQTKIEMQWGFQAGILVGVLASWVFILTAPWQWYFKVFSSIGELGIVGSLIFSLVELTKMRKNYIEMQKMMDTATPKTNPNELNPPKYAG